MVSRLQGSQCEPCFLVDHLLDILLPVFGAVRTVALPPQFRSEAGCCLDTCCFEGALRNQVSSSRASAHPVGTRNRLMSCILSSPTYLHTTCFFVVISIPGDRSRWTGFWMYVSRHDLLRSHATYEEINFLKKNPATGGKEKKEKRNEASWTRRTRDRGRKGGFHSLNISLCRQAAVAVASQLLSPLTLM